MAARVQDRIAYLIKSKPVAGGALRPFAIATCHGCAAVKEIRLNGPARHPDLIGQKFASEGWAFDPFNPNRITCPGCLARRAAGRRGESARAVSVLPPLQDDPRGAPVVPLHLKPVAPKPVAPVLALPPNKTELTVAERARVRDTLVGTFDEKAGQYSEGWSDLRVAEEVGGVPAKLVADLREIAFGPLRSVVELDPLQARLDQAEARVETILRDLAAVRDEQAKLRQALADTAKRLGVR